MASDTAAVAVHGATIRRGWGQTVAAVALLALFALVLYARLLFGGRVLAEGDGLLYFLPLREFASEALRSGRLPLWNPYLFAGAPFLANPQAAVLYPLHWPLSWLPAHEQIYWSAALHVWLLGVGGYLLVRRVGGGFLASLTAGLVLQGSGFVGGLVGHLNQLNGAAWLPWLLFLLTPPTRGRTRANAVLDGAWLALVISLMLLAGHTQTTYINLAGAGLWALLLGVRTWRERRIAAIEPVWTAGIAASATPLVVLVVASALGAALSMPQLLPTLELSERSLRSGGLSYVDATSFSLQPLDLPWTLMPTYGLVDLEVRFGTPAWSEFLGWVGLVALALAAWGLWVNLRRRRLNGASHASPQSGAEWLLVMGGLLLAGAGLLLALGRWNPLYWLLYQVLPGFDLFRTPARWMMLYTQGMALLAAAGMMALTARGDRVTRWAPLVPLLVAVDLFAASLALPSAHPTAPLAVEAIRTAPAHLLTAPDRLAALTAGLDPAAAGRSLGMSTITYDPGDMADLARIYRDPAAPQLSQDAFDRLVIALKVQELMAPNLPLVHGVPALDGYDGGVLPTERFTQLATLLVPADALVPDGRLREQIDELPSAALLRLLDVRHVLTDKVRDLWFDDVFYDRQIGARLTADMAALTVEAAPPLPPFEATHVDLIGWVEAVDGGALPDLSDEALSVATVRMVGMDGSEAGGAVLTAGGAPGAGLADDTLDSPLAESSGALVAYRDVEGSRQEYRVRLPLAAPSTLQSITMQATEPGIAVVVRAVTLLDARSGMFRALLPSDRGAFALTHSGDVKIYESLEAGSRASLYGDVVTATSSAKALDLLRTVDTDGQVVVEGALPAWFDSESASPAGEGKVELLSYAAESLELRTESDAPALLLLRDAWDPGWSATVDGLPAQILPANVYFRGLFVPAGEHLIRMVYSPPRWELGLLVAVVAALIWVGALLWALRKRGRERVGRAKSGIFPAAL